MGRNMLAGAAGDRLNAMLAAVGFNLVKLMRGLKRLFLCLRTEAGGFAAFLAELVWTVMCAGQANPAALRCRRTITNQGFA